MFIIDKGMLIAVGGMEAYVRTYARALAHGHTMRERGKDNTRYFINQRENIIIRDYLPAR